MYHSFEINIESYLYDHIPLRHIDAHLLMVFGFSIIKIVKVHQCYMDIIYDTMDKDGNAKTFPLFGDINICTPKCTFGHQMAFSLQLNLPRFLSL